MLFVLIIYGGEKILGKGVFRLISGYMVLTMLNGIWIEERLALLVEFIKKINENSRMGECLNIDNFEEDIRQYWPYLIIFAPE